MILTAIAGRPAARSSSRWREASALLYLGATLIGFNFGGNFALFPAFTADKFGNDTVGRNYPCVFLSYGAGGIVFPILAGRLGDTGRFPLAFTICAASPAWWGGGHLGGVPPSTRRQPSRSPGSVSWAI